MPPTDTHSDFSRFVRYTSNCVTFTQSLSASFFYDAAFVDRATDFSDDDMLASNDGCEAGLVAHDPDIAAVDPDFGDDGHEIGPLRLNIGVLIFCLLDISDLARHPVS